MEELLRHPFFWGLATGLVLTVITILANIKSNLALKSTIRELKTALDVQQRTQLELSSKREEELKNLQGQIDNLKETNTFLRQKPSAQELRQLQIYEETLRLMTENAPGFAQAWQKQLRDVEIHVGESNSGITRLVKKFFSSGKETLPTQSEKSQKKSEIEVIPPNQRD